MPLLRFRNDVIFIAGRSFRIDSTPIGGVPLDTWPCQAGKHLRPSTTTTMAMMTTMMVALTREGGVTERSPRGARTAAARGEHGMDSRSRCWGTCGGQRWGKRDSSARGPRQQMSRRPPGQQPSQRCSASGSVEISAAAMSRTGRPIFSAADMTPHLLTAKDAG